MMALFDFAQLELRPPRGLETEWLLTNGLGGFAGSTISGINTRRYHGLLMGALRPPVDRRLFLAKLEEELYLGDEKYSLFSSKTTGGYSGYGFDYLQEFIRYPFPTYVYRVQDVMLEKEIFMIHGKNAVIIRYCISNPCQRSVRVSVFPLLTCRDYHHLTRCCEWPFHTRELGTGVMVQAYNGAPPLYIYSDAAAWQKTGYWYYNVFYNEEAMRGLDAVEDLYCPVRLDIEARGDSTFWVAASLEPLPATNQWFTEQRGRELQRIEEIVKSARIDNRYFKILTLSADAFLVKRHDGEGLSIIAGYPWFADWGRDTMLALPGLTLVTGRYDEFRSIVRMYLQFEKDGLLPNVFPDQPGLPAYNTVDAPLWVFWTLYKYWQYTGDWGFVEEAYPVLRKIIDHYEAGTHFGIRMDRDGLITQGVEGYALTWMDARVEGRPVTPRQGKPVEINALWHFALLMDAYMASRLGMQGRARERKELVQRVKRSFAEQFWYEEGGYLYDVLGDDGKDTSLRCNQVIALSLPARILDARREKAILQSVWQYLYTPYGLRTLAPNAPGYRPHYGGSEHERDRAYHQGTVWVWPWGHFVTAVNRVLGYSPSNQRIIRRMLEPLLIHLRHAGLGMVSEIFDAEEPHRSQGCIAQAWSVAEVLRVFYEELSGEFRHSMLDEEPYFS